MSLSLASTDHLYAALQRLATQARFGYSTELEMQFKDERLALAKQRH